MICILLGTGLGAFTHGVLSSRGPEYGVPQMVLSRIPFGWFGNALPAGLNAVIAGVGWFAVNSVSGALALNALTSLPKWLCLVIVVVAQVVIAYFGHNLVQVFERYAAPVLAIIFAIRSVWTGRPSLAPSRSTTCIQAAPASRNARAVSRGSTE